MAQASISVYGESTIYGKSAIGEWDLRLNGFELARGEQHRMEILRSGLASIENFVWGPAMLVLLLGVGVYLTLGLKFMPLRRIGTAFRLTFSGIHSKKGAKGDITPFQALTTALSATVGTGNIAGVATAITLGGPGAIFWMWVTALVGMATKYAEAVLAVRYREKDERGHYVGGPMYYIKHGLGKRWVWLGGAFAFFTVCSGLTTGNMIQANSIALVLESNLHIAPWKTGVGLSILTFAVIIGGIKSIARMAEFLIPFMAVAYVCGGLVILGLNFTFIPAAFKLIFDGAFSGTAATGGFAGAAMIYAIQWGVSRGVFSNEAGLGSAAIAHAAAATDDPVKQGTVAMLGTFIDTIVLCSITALVILTIYVPYTAAGGESVMIGAWASGKDGSALSALAFGNGVSGGQWIVTFGLAIFAFTTIVSWSYYTERAAEYLFGIKVIFPLRLLWVLVLPLGALAELRLVWSLGSIMNALMAIPNLIALVLLSGTVFAMTRSANKKGKGQES